MRVALILTLALALSLLALLTQPIGAVDRKKFRTCADTAFCQRLRDPSSSHQYAIGDTSTNGAILTAAVTNIAHPLQPKLALSVKVMTDGIVNVQIQESQPLHPRWVIRDVIEPAAQTPHTAVQWKNHGAKTIAKFDSRHTDLNGEVSVSNCELEIQHSPLTMTLSINGVPSILFNSQSLLFYEQYRERNPRPSLTQTVDGAESSVPAPDADPLTVSFPYDSDGMWEESHGGHTDHKARGPAAIGADFSFPKSKHVFGIPEHASSFALKSTRGANSGDYNEPYRLWNLDVFEYELNEPMALYGAVPYVVSHSADSTVGVLWLNSAETYIDITDSTTGGSLLSSGSPNKHVHWISESGIVDFYLLPGPTPQSLFTQYKDLTGAPSLPPYFSIAYHQSRWNYKSEEDVAGVDAAFDQHDIPYDVLWLDIEHTDGKKYFTWDSRHFPNPKQMQQSLAGKGRMMVTIVDPHMKRDSGWAIHQQALDNDYYVKTGSGAVYDGWCWPGSSSYLDFLDERVRAYWASLFALDKYEGSTPTLYVWNDMNEPSVFNGPEVTMPKDNKHLSLSVEHRDVHNMYGYYNHLSTYLGLKQRDNARPFVLSRSFFAGSQKYAAIWTGDNLADWAHLAASVPMILSLNIAGIVFSGADVGGFFKDPDAELITRWYQLAAYQPFFRGHAHIDAKRREPWLFGEPYTAHIQRAIRARYQLLPYIYTAFYESSATGMPIARPLWVEFPTDASLFNEEQEYLLGSSILVAPVTASGQSSVSVRLPAGRWYDVNSNYQVHSGPASLTASVTMDFIPVYYRGGSVIARKDRPRRSSSLMKFDPFTLIIAVDENQRAAGSLYLDDGKSFNYQQGQFAFRHFSFDGTTLTASQHNSSSVVSSQQSYSDRATIERIVIVGLKSPSTVSTARVTVPNRPPYSASVVQGNDGSVTIRKPDATITSDFTIQLH